MITCQVCGDDHVTQYAARLHRATVHPPHQQAALRALVIRLAAATITIAMATLALLTAWVAVVLHFLTAGPAPLGVAALIAGTWVLTRYALALASRAHHDQHELDASQEDHP